MEFPQSLNKHFLLIVILHSSFLFHTAISQFERNAIFAYKSNFNNPILSDPAEDATNPNQSCSSSSSSSSKISKIGIMLLLFDVIGFVAVSLLFILYSKRAKRLKKMIERINDLEQSKEIGYKDDQEEEEEEEEHTREKVSRVEPIQKEVPGKEIVVVGEEKRNLIFLEEEVNFELNDLLKASAEGLGKGIFGHSYKAMMDGNKVTVVVKRLRDLKPLSIEEFMRNLNGIAQLKHPNLLPLLAYYCSLEEKLLVSKFAAGGNLYNRIHGGRGNKDRIPFRWNARLSVARGVARALEYLHLNTKITTNRSPSSPTTNIIIPHGNLKSTNVLLDKNDIVFVSDYGFSPLIAQPIAIARMVSYKSPECLQSWKRVSRKSDVWSYGCLVLELLTGRVPAYSAPSGGNGVDLCSWVYRTVREEWTGEIFDPELSGQRNSTDGMLKLLQIAIQCCEKSPEKRPEMTEVVREVESIRVVESAESDDSSFDQSLTDESWSNSHSGTMGDER